MYFFIQMAYELFAQNRKLNKRGGPNKSGRGGGGGGVEVGNFFEKN